MMGVDLFGIFLKVHAKNLVYDETLMSTGDWRYDLNNLEDNESMMEKHHKLDDISI